MDDFALDTRAELIAQSAELSLNGKETLSESYHHSISRWRPNRTE